MIREHEIWLSAALKTGVPTMRIPVRKVSEGGFARLMASAAGRWRAERWWDAALGKLKD